MTLPINIVGQEEGETLAALSEQPQIIPTEFGVNIEFHEGQFNPNQIKFLIYGESGSGKTVFSSTWPRPLFVDIDKGMASITRKVHRINIETWADLDNSVTFLTAGQHHFKTVIVDSLNELQALAMSTTVEKYPNIRRAYDNLPSQSDYGKMLDDADKMVRRLKALSMNVVFVCNSAPQEYETDIIQPQLIGKSSARNLSRKMDVIGYLYKVEPSGGGRKKRILVFDAVGYVTKDRSGVLPTSVEDPTYRTLYDFWKTRYKPKEIKE